MNPISLYFLKRRMAKFYDVVDGQKRYVGGLLPDTVDKRDLDTVGLFGLWEDYAPLHDDLTLPNLGFKNQQQLNICGWVSTTTDRENTEQCKLAEQGIVQFGVKDGYISGDGFSQLRDNCKVAQTRGIPEARFLPNDPSVGWTEYSKFSMSNEAIANAYTHRAQSYAQVTSKNQLLKLLDEGHYIHTGSPWYAEYNMSYGFSYPWIIGPSTGKTLVGGHAFEIAGYVKNYLGKGMHLRFQNSYGPSWGDRGYFYMPIDFAMNFLYSRWVMLDIQVDVARFLQDNAGKNVKATGGKAVYHIESGKKFAYPDWLTFLAYGGLKEEILPVDADTLAAVTAGPNMDIKTSPYWNLIKEMSYPDNYKKLLQLTAENGIKLDTDSLGAIFHELYLIKPNQ